MLLDVNAASSPLKLTQRWQPGLRYDYYYTSYSNVRKRKWPSVAEIREKKVHCRRFSITRALLHGVVSVFVLLLQDFHFSSLYDRFWSYDVLWKPAAQLQLTVHVLHLWERRTWQQLPPSAFDFVSFALLSTNKTPPWRATKASERPCQGTTQYNPKVQTRSLSIE